MLQKHFNKTRTMITQHMSHIEKAVTLDIRKRVQEALATAKNSARALVASAKTKAISEAVAKSDQRLEAALRKADSAATMNMVELKKNCATALQEVGG